MPGLRGRTWTPASRSRHGGAHGHAGAGRRLATRGEDGIDTWRTRPWFLAALRRLYEPFMALTAVALAASVALSYAFVLSGSMQNHLTQLDGFAYAVFALDFAVRLYMARGARRRFMATHWVDLIALLPLGVVVGRAFQWYRALRALVMLRRYSEFFHGVFLRHGFIYMVIVTFGLVLGGAYAIQRVEPGLGNFGDALWWSFVTTTTVGYGDIAPKTPAGRAVAVVLMLLGIGFIGLFTGTVATFFLERTSARRRPGVLGEQWEVLRDRLDHLDELSPQEFAEVQASLDGLYRASAALKDRADREDQAVPHGRRVVRVRRASGRGAPAGPRTGRGAERPG